LRPGKIPSTLCLRHHEARRDKIRFRVIRDPALVKIKKERGYVEIDVLGGFDAFQETRRID